MISNLYGRIIRINSNDFKHFSPYNLCVHSGCVIAYYKYPSSTTSGVFATYTMKTNEECGALCTSQNNCKGYGHNSVTLACYVSANDDPTPDTYSWSFYTKMCLKGILVQAANKECSIIFEGINSSATTYEQSYNYLKYVYGCNSVFYINFTCALWVFLIRLKSKRFLALLHFHM